MPLFTLTPFRILVTLLFTLTPFRILVTLLFTLTPFRILVTLLFTLTPFRIPVAFSLYPPVSTIFHFPFLPPCYISVVILLQNPARKS